jgi:hypothetical protein
VTPEKPRAEIEIREDGSTMERFESLTRRLLGVSKAEVKVEEEPWKKDRGKRRRAVTGKADK